MRILALPRGKPAAITARLIQLACKWCTTELHRLAILIPLLQIQRIAQTTPTLCTALVCTFQQLALLVLQTMSQWCHRILVYWTLAQVA